MKRQNRRATLLTLLAAFYLPLSLVTGIFGMNIKEFNDKAPPFYLCFEALFAIIAVTAIFYRLYRYLPLAFRKPRNRQSHPQARRQPSGPLTWLDILLCPLHTIYWPSRNSSASGSYGPRKKNLWRVNTSWDDMWAF